MRGYGRHSHTVIVPSHFAIGDEFEPEILTNSSEERDILS